MLKRIKGFFVQEKGLGRDHLASLNRLPFDERLAELGSVLHEICVKQAARFVEEDHRRADSPFRDLPKADLFHELLVMNVWVFAWLFNGKQPALMDRLYHHYSTSFVWGRESSHKELMDAIRVKFAAYDKSWDDYSGHQDVFARQAIGIIFRGQQVAESPQAAFWLISYADQTMKDFAAIGKSANLLPREKDEDA